MKFYQEWTAAKSDTDTKKFGKPFAAQVPGNVQYDYAKSVGKEDFFFNDGVEFFDNLENCTWKYSTKLNYNANSEEKIYFVAEGIDYLFDIILDGNKIYGGEGMYTAVKTDITDIVHPGSVLEIIIHPHPKRDGAPKGTRYEADECCKPPINYGWDWCPRLLVSGLWQPAYIETCGAGHIYSCEAFYTLNSERNKAHVVFKSVCEEEITYTLRDPDGATVYSGTKNEFDIENVRLWWCNGQGPQNLYTWEASAKTHSLTGTIGFKTVRLVHNEGTENVVGFPKSRYCPAITIELNGRRIFAKGSNYVNPEVFLGKVKPDTYRKQVKLAKEANMNILRCWGGAGIHKREFYEECDKQGIMVWQEFMLACNNYKNNEHYLSVLEREATSIIKQLRSHVSLVLWCGGNELFNNWSGMDEQSFALRLLNKLCYEHNKEIPFIMTSPVYGMGHGGYVFFDEESNKDVFQLFAEANCTAYTEFGVPSITSADNLRKIIPEDELFPINPTKAWKLHHGFNAWVGDTWVCNKLTERYFGKDTALSQRIEHSNLLQSVGYKAIFEESRRQWGHCSMALNWCFNEPWITAAGNSLLAYPQEPKPAYYAVRQSLKGALASARIPKFEWKSGEIFKAELWYLNDTVNTLSDEIDVTLTIGNKTYNLLHWSVDEVFANTNKIGPAVNFVLPNVKDADFVLLTLKSQNSADNEYKLLFKHDTEVDTTGTMNV